MVEAKQAFVIHVREMKEYPDAVYIGRAMPRRRLRASKWQNPFRITDTQSREEVIELFRLHMTVGEGRHLDLTELEGKPLACWCRHSNEPLTAEAACHGDILATMVNDRGAER